MIHPIEIKLDHDLTPPPAYIRFSHARVARTDSVDPDGAVNVDRDADGRIVGIELIAVDAYTLGLAAQVARAHDLALPEMPAHAA